MHVIQLVICALKNLFDRLTVLMLMLSANGAKMILIPFKAMKMPTNGTVSSRSLFPHLIGLENTIGISTLCWVPPAYACIKIQHFPSMNRRNIKLIFFFANFHSPCKDYPTQNSPQHLSSKGGKAGLGTAEHFSRWGRGGCLLVT